MSGVPPSGGSQSQPGFDRAGGIQPPGDLTRSGSGLTWSRSGSDSMPTIVGGRVAWVKVPVRPDREARRFPQRCLARVAALVRRLGIGAVARELGVSRQSVSDLVKAAGILTTALAERWPPRRLGRRARQGTWEYPAFAICPARPALSWPACPRSSFDASQPSVDDARGTPRRKSEPSRFLAKMAPTLRASSRLSLPLGSSRGCIPR
jgi:hypothetical protein